MSILKALSVILYVGVAAPHSTSTDAAHDTVFDRNLITKDTTDAFRDVVDGQHAIASGATDAVRDTVFDRNLITKDSTDALRDVVDGRNTIASGATDAVRDTVFGRNPITKDTTDAVHDTIYDRALITKDTTDAFRDVVDGQYAIASGATDAVRDAIYDRNLITKNTTDAVHDTIYDRTLITKDTTDVVRDVADARNTIASGATDAVHDTIYDRILITKDTTDAVRDVVDAQNTMASGLTDAVRVDIDAGRNLISSGDTAERRNPVSSGGPDVVYDDADGRNSTNGTYDYSLPAGNESSDCSNEYCVSDEDYLAMIEDYIFPSVYEWLLISLHATVFVVGLVGNALVFYSVYHNHSMRTVTNYYIVNLAVADFLVILICLPPTVLWDVTKTWFFGSLTCKLVLYLQNVSVSVSVLTLTFISVDRWKAICHPLDFNSTPGRAKVSILLIWALSLVIALPEGVVLDTRPPALPMDTVYLTDCVHTWSETSTKVYQLFLISVLYVSPLVLMACAYYQITRVLWNKNIPGANEVNQPTLRMSENRAPPVRSGNSGCESQIRSRRKASKMLMAVVVMFSLCYFPVHLINALRYTVGLPQNPATSVASLVSHWLCYANSAINPIIYNIMNGKFRKEFKNIFTCQCLRKGKRQSRYQATYLCKYTSTVTHCDRRIRELPNFTEKRD